MPDKTADRIRDTAQRMVDKNKNLHLLQERYEQMGRLQYKLPSPLNEFDWIRPIVDTSPYDALRGVKRALANLQMDVTVHPVCVMKAIGEEDDQTKAVKERANEWETTLKWSMGRTANRRAAFYDSVIHSAALYHEIVGQVIHVPTQFKVMGSKNGRAEAAARFGDWAIKLVDPKCVNVDYSDYMPERVLSAVKKTAKDIVDFWGDAASEIQEKIDKNADYSDTVLVECDYVDYENRMVWIIEEDQEIDDNKGIIILGPEPWLKTTGGKPVPFLPWVCVAGGTDIDSEPEFQRQPLFFPVAMAEQWINTNLMGTLEFSRAIAEAASPSQVIKGPGAEDVVTEYGEPGGRIILNQFQEFELLRKQGLDPAIMQAYDRMQQAISRATVADILVTGQPMGGVEAFAAYNLQVQIAIASLGDFKHLGERFYEQAYELMLLITHYTGKEITGYGDGVEKYVIDSEDIDPEAIYIKVTLKPDVPTDRVQRVNAAVTMAQNLKYPTPRILETLGETDPEGAMNEWKVEQMDFAYLQGLLQKLQMEGSGELQKMAQALQMQQQQMAMMQKRGNQPNLQRGIRGVEGQQYNPAMGGQPPAEVSPASTREMQTGRARGGAPVAEV